MKTLMRDSLSVLPGVRKLGHRDWFLLQALGRGHEVSGKLSRRKAIPAHINHGRWLVDCPLELEKQPCVGAECVTEDDPVFLCLSCGNVQAKGAFLKVIFPPAEDRDRFELALTTRPESLRNWLPGETPEKIAEENRKHGIVVPEGAE